MVYYFEENVKLEGLGSTLLTSRSLAEKVIAEFEGDYLSITGDPGYIDSDWHPPVTFPWEV